jgi:hypothetical protein
MFPTTPDPPEDPRVPPSPEPFGPPPVARVSGARKIVARSFTWSHPPNPPPAPSANTDAPLTTAPPSVLPLRLPVLDVERIDLPSGVCTVAP